MNNRSFLLFVSYFFTSALAFQTFVPSSAITRRGTALQASVTIYGHPGTRSPLVNWACHELGIDFDMGDLGRNPHPFGQLPCLTEGEAVLFESGAILQHLNRKYAKDLTDAEQAAVTSWITWANASLDPICFLETPEGKVYDTGLGKPNKRIARLDELLKGDFLLGSKFTLADVAVASYLLYVIQFFPDTKIPYKNVKAYMKRCASRPLYAQAFGKNVQDYLVSKLDEEKKIFGMF